VRSARRDGITVRLIDFPVVQAHLSVRFFVVGESSRVWQSGLRYTSQDFSITTRTIPMKKMLSLFLTLLAVTFALSGCSPSREPLSTRVNEVIDLGVKPLPNSDNQLHGYRVVNSVGSEDHFVYVVERNGEPVAGTSTNRRVSAGKTAHDYEVSTVIADSAKGPSSPTLQLTCVDEAQCARFVAAINAVK
jgi:hypothetical protein